MRTTPKPSCPLGTSTLLPKTGGRHPWGVPLRRHPPPSVWKNSLGAWTAAREEPRSRREGGAGRGPAPPAAGGCSPSCEQCAGKGGEQVRGAWRLFPPPGALICTEPKVSIVKLLRAHLAPPRRPASPFESVSVWSFEEKMLLSLYFPPWCGWLLLLRGCSRLRPPLPFTPLPPQHPPTSTWFSNHRALVRAGGGCPFLHPR